MANNRAHVVSFEDSPLNLSSELKSREYNEYINSLKTSVLRAINRSREVTERQDELTMALTAENEMVSKAVRQLAGVPSTSDGIVITGFDSPIGSETTARVDPLFGQVTSNYVEQNIYSKVSRIVDVNGKKRPSRDTYITWGPEGSAVAMAQSDPIYNILDGTNTAFWITEIDPGAVGTPHVLSIQFPKSIRPYINSVTVTPFPAFTFRMNSVSVTTPNSNIVAVLSDMDAQFDTGMRAHFKPEPWGDTLTINLTPQNTVIGIADITVDLIDYNNEDAQVVYELTDLEDVAITSIKEVELDLTAQGANPLTFDPLQTDDVVSFAVGTPSSFLPFDYQKQTDLGISKTASDSLYMRVKFRQRQGHSPVFKSAIVRYE